MKRPILILGGVAVLVLVAAAFIGGKLIQQRSSDADLAQLLMQVTPSGVNETEIASLRIPLSIGPLDLLPDEQLRQR
jgi:hypothetical protein